MDIDAATVIAVYLALPICGIMFGTTLALIAGEDFKEALKTGGYMAIIGIGMLFIFTIMLLIVAGAVFLLTEV